MNKNILISLLAFSLLVSTSLHAQRARHTFKLGTSEFLLDEKPFQIISGEIHPARVPAEYWKQRIQMAKAMGCNTISAPIFWNYHESEKGVYDFSTGNRNIAEFLRIVAEEEMWLILKPGPYVPGEWELGGIPPYLLRNQEIKLRSMDPVYMAAAESYMARLAQEIKPYLITKGGPVIMIQIENEYGKFGIDKNYLHRIKDIWIENGINIPSYTADLPTAEMLEAGTIQGCAVGLNSGGSQADFDLAAKINPGVPVFCCEISPVKVNYWGDKYERADSLALYSQIKFMMDNKKSFNIHINRCSNFGFSAGAGSEGPAKYELVLTSYAYDAPVTEQGSITAKYTMIRNLLGSYLPKKEKLPEIPTPIPVMEIPGFFLTVFTSLWDNLPQPVISEDPGTFESYGQDYGLMLYRTELTGSKSGNLSISAVHDFGSVFLNGAFIGTIDRREGVNSIVIPESKVDKPVLEILVEGTGRYYDGKDLIDRKGIIGSVTLNEESLKNWKIYKFPLDNKFIYSLRSSGKTLNKGIFFKGNISLISNSDTYFDVTNFTKGVIWVNGHNLGRFWNIGPQKRLYCPGSWLKIGMNEVLIFDMIETQPKLIISTTSME